MWSFFGSKRVTDKRLENALKSRAGIMQTLICFYYSERDLFTPQNEIVLRSFYIHGQRIRVCAGTSRYKPLESCWKDSGKIVERPWRTVKIT